MMIDEDTVAKPKDRLNEENETYSIIRQHNSTKGYELECTTLARKAPQ